MKEHKPYHLAVLAFDTSAYTTSVAAIQEDGRIVADERRLLEVKTGERGLRQSQAFFQHISRLPELTKKVCDQIRECGCVISAIAASSRPRPEKHSYMPVFMAGLRTAENIAAALDVPLYTYSHQEGHIAAAAGVLPKKEKALAFHLSGGTSELLLIEGCSPVRIVGKTKDLSFGQLIDRTGVACGMPFPAGKMMDEAAIRGIGVLYTHFSRRGNRIYEDPVLSGIHLDGTEWNLSGIENSCIKAVAEGVSVERIAAELFQRTADAIVSVISEAASRECVTKVVLAGGVASSGFLQEQVRRELGRRGIHAQFGAPEYCSDNAVGIARLGLDACLAAKLNS